MTEQDKKLLTAKIEDLFGLCEKYCEPRFSDFLDGAEQAAVNREVLFPYGFGVMIYGGFPDAEKKIIGVFPEWEEPSPEAFPIVCLRAEGGYSRTLTHRDYLGSVMGLGIAPSKLGDIVVGDGGAYIFLHRDIAGYVSESLSKIGRESVKISLIEDPSAVTIERKYLTVETVCASERLDALTAAAANISRSEAAKLIDGGKVKLNHLEVTKTSEPVKEGDLLSIRGSGRFIVDGFGAETRKKRLHVTLKKFI